MSLPRSTTQISNGEIPREAKRQDWRELTDRLPGLGCDEGGLSLLASASIEQDKAHLRWTLFGNCELDPGRAFWKSFYTGPGEEMPAAQALEFFRALLAKAYDEPRDALTDLRKAGFAILASETEHGSLPTWAAEYLADEKSPRNEPRDAHGASQRFIRFLHFALHRDTPLQCGHSYPCSGRIASTTGSTIPAGASPQINAVNGGLPPHIVFRLSTVVVCSTSCVRPQATGKPHRCAENRRRDEP